MKYTQRQIIIKYLKEHPEGLNSYDADYQLKIKQAPTRIHEIKNLGYTIHTTTNKDRSVTWSLTNFPTEPKKPQYEFIGNTAVLIK